LSLPHWIKWNKVKGKYEINNNMKCFEQSAKEIKKRHNKTMIEIWKTTNFDDKPMITIVDNRNGDVSNYVLEGKKEKLPKNEDNKENGLEYIDTDDYLKPNGYKRMRTLEDILE